ncbi:MAG: hypothetical protein V2I36_08075 [Desulfopila sp.]|jgi:uncharacterized membrane protein YdjX (TVP38/TMEM64 family)|nr:hypothetical protein [Desulfopila sp.]
MQKRPPLSKKDIVILGTKISLLLLCLFGLFLFVRTHAPVRALDEYLQGSISPAVFLLLMLALPVAGAPLSPFLVLIGMKFGTVEGISLSGIIMLMQMTLTYFLVNSFLRKWIFRLLEFFHIPVARFNDDHSRWHAFIFMLVPGLPYVAKNNLLALTGMGLTPYLTINWVAQFGLSVPLILLGGAVMEMNLVILGIAFLLLLAAYLLQYFLRKRYRNTT